MIPNLMTKKRMRKLWQAVALLMAVAVPNAQAATRTWNGGNGGGPTDWNRSQNWSGNAVPLAADDALFNGSLNLTANLSAGSAVRTITFSSGGGYTIGGAFTLTLGGATAAGMSNNVANVTQTFSVGTINLAASQIWSATSGDLTFSGTTIGLGASQTLTLDAASARTITIANSITGTGTSGITKTGAGTLILSGTSTYSGPTTVSAGTLRISTGANRLPTGTAVSIANVAGAIFDLNNQNQTIGSLAGGGATGGSVTLGSGTLTVGDANNTTFAGVISGGGGLVKQGAGTLTLSGANTYSGTTVINAGKLQISTGANRLPTGTAVSLANVASAILDLNNQNQTIGSLAGGGAIGGNVTLGSGTLTVGDSTSTSYGGVVSGSGGIVKQGSGTLTLSGANTYGGATMISGGAITLSGGNDRLPTGTSVDIASSSTLNLNNNNQTVAAVTGSGNVTLGSGGLTIGNSGNSLFSGSISGSGSLTKQGSGTVTLAGNNSYGNTVVSGGTLKVGNSGTSGTLGSGGVSVASGSTLAINRSDAVSLNNNISGAGSVRQEGAGALTLGGANSYTGGTILAAGSTLVVGANNALPTGIGVNTPGGITMNNGSTLDLNNKTVGDYGTASSVGALTLSGSSWVLQLNPDATDGSITFSSLAGYTGGQLSIWGWEGPVTLGGAPGTGDRIFFLNDPSGAFPTFLGNVQFYSDNGITPMGDGATILNGELVPVPEPINVALGIFGAGFVGINFARRYVAKKRATAAVAVAA